MHRTRLPRSTELAILVGCLVVVLSAAAFQLGAVLGLELKAHLFVVPGVVALIAGAVLVYVGRIRHHERELQEEVARQAREVQRLNQALEQKVEDRTAQLRAREAELFQAQKLEALGRLAGGVAHDFNNLLTGVLQGAELLEELADEPDTVRELAGEVQDAATRAAQLTGRLLALGRRRRVPHPPRPTDLADVVRGLEPILKRLMGEHSVVLIELAPGTPSILADRVHLEQVVVNLAVNARDAMPDGGRFTVQVSANTPDTPSFELPAPAPHGTIRLRVQDTGHGIPADIQEKIFEPLFTTKEPDMGTGLGLSIVHSLVQGAGGTVRLDSEVGRGATFDVYWPALGPDVLAVPSEPEVPTGAVPTIAEGPLRILLIDDDDHVRRMVARALSMRGHTIEAAEDGDAAEALARDRGDVFQVVLSDIRMPGRSGVELIPLWRSVLPSARIVLMTGLTDHVLDDTRRAELGIGEVLRKPFDLDKLTSILAG